MLQKLIEINKTYLIAYPKAESLLNYHVAFGSEALIRIHKKAKGRLIIFKNLGGHDETNYFFK